MAGDKGGRRFSKARGAWKCDAPSVVFLLLCMHDCSQRLNYRLLTLKTEVQTVAEECPVAFLFYRDKNGEAGEGLRVRQSF